MNPAFSRVIIPCVAAGKPVARFYLRKWCVDKTRGDRGARESTGRVGGESRRLWEIITRRSDYTRARYTQLRPDFGGKRPRSAPTRRHGIRGRKNDRVVGPMRKCGGVTRTRALRNSSNVASCPLSFRWVVAIV